MKEERSNETVELRGKKDGKSGWKLRGEEEEREGKMRIAWSRAGAVPHLSEEAGLRKNKS